MDSKRVEEILSGVLHPVSEKSITSLGMVEDIHVEENLIRFKLVFPSPDPLSSTIKKSCEEAIRSNYPDPQLKISIMELIKKRKIATKKAHIEMGHETLSEVKHIIAVASGKGGVGKSTVSVNLAISLAKMGYKVGLTDADVYGPSIPLMTETEDYKPMIDDSSGKDLILPILKYGVKWISIGYFSAAGQPLIWRGPMASNALKQMVLQVEWGELDYLIIDLPPGTGDVHISTVSDLPLTGAVVVTTPQSVALTDVEKGINMFKAEGIEKPIIGIVENMAWFTPAELPDNRYYIFGKEGGKEMAEQFGIPLLAQIPLILSIREGGDSGKPIALSDGQDAQAFHQLAEKVAAIVEE